MQFLKKYPESILLLVFYGFGVNTLIVGLTTNVILSWQHFAGFVTLVVITFLYFKVHKRLIEILLALGLLNFINLNVSSITVGLGIGLAGDNMNSIGIQPYFLLATIAYVILNRDWIFAKNELTERQKQEQLQRQANTWKEKYSNKTETELRQIVANKQNYQTEAVYAAEQLLNEKYADEEKR